MRHRETKTHHVIRAGLPIVLAQHQGTSARTAIDIATAHRPNCTGNVPDLPIFRVTACNPLPEMAKLTSRPAPRSTARKPPSKHAGTKRKASDGKPVMDADTKAIQALLSR